MSPARFAQHFLINQEALLRIVDSLNLSPQDNVIEIGPGLGALTAPLMASGAQVVSIEIDLRMINELTKKFSGAKNFTLIQKDFLKFNFDGLPKISDGKLYKVVGNLPYNITSPILRKLSEWKDWSFAVLMVQKEVGTRLCAQPGNTNYGAITVGVNLTCQVEHLFDVGPSSFRPRPRVESSVLKVVRRQKQLTDNIIGTQKVIQAAFQQRRKTILNSLSHGLGFDKGRVESVLEVLGISSTLRAENLSVDQFIKLTSDLGITES